MFINSFDIDGVIFMGPGRGGVYPGPNDIIITGRSFEEEKETREMLESKGITNFVYMNPERYSDKTRVSSGQHKGNTIAKLKESGTIVQIHFEDDPIQAAEIRRICPDVTVVELVHDLVTKENTRHTEY